MQKKKILHLITGLEIGGTETQLLKILPQLQNNFDNLVCCVRGRGAIGGRLRDAGIPVRYLDYKNIFDFKIILKFREIIIEFHPDILVTYLIHADLFGRIFGRIFGIKKIICSQRGALLNWNFLRFFDIITSFLVTKYLTQTEIAKKELSKIYCFSQERFEVVPNSIDISVYEFDLDKAKKKQELAINPTNLNIVCVSNLRKGKGHEYLLTAFENLYETCKNINLLIVGDGKLMNALLKQVKNYKSKENIYFLGNRDDVKEILKISEIFVLATEAEGMSNAILEAMAAKVPIITTLIPENKELLADTSAILVKSRRSSEIKGAINLLMHDEVLREKISQNAHGIVKDKYSMEIITKKLVDLYEKII